MIKPEFLMMVGLSLFLVFEPTSAENYWMGLKIAPEHRCTPYNSKSYSYSQSVEKRIVELMGRIYGPYTGQCFKSVQETDIEHIVARSEAHDSGLCASGERIRREFSRDLLNLTLASPSVNRYQKGARDAAEWLPDQNKCWFAKRIVDVKTKYQLTVDRSEAEALSAVLSRCDSTDMIFYKCVNGQPEPYLENDQPSALKSNHPLAMWDENGNGRITCSEARKHGIAPVRRGHPAYVYMRDGDGDGIVCE